MGAPIQVPKDTNPSQEAVLQMHKKYCNELMKLYNRYKDIYATDRTDDMKFAGIEQSRL